MESDTIQSVTCRVQTVFTKLAQDVAQGVQLAQNFRHILGVLSPQNVHDGNCPSRPTDRATRLPC